MSKLTVGAGWFVLWDEFRADRYAGPLAASLERWTGNAWLADDARPLLTSGRALTYPGLGRRLGETTLFRVRVEAAGLRALYPADRDRFEEFFDATVDGREFEVEPYDDEHPPGPVAQPKPELLRLVPAVTCAYPPATRVVRGSVRTPSGTPVAGALVQAESPGEWRERTLTGPDGAFRLALRWRGTVDDPDELRPRFEDFTLTAHDAPGRSGSLDIRLDRDADRPGGTEPLPHVIEIGE
ncbi:MAG: carboxypeptidase-like regulatory domain-containing protein [Actinoplanes sp.]